MRRTIATAITVLALAACSPYDTPADAGPMRGYAEFASTLPAPRQGPHTCDRACWERIIARQHAERLWWAEVVKRQKREAEARRIARLYAFAHAVEQARLARLALGGYPAPRPIGGGLLMGSGRCGAAYGLPPCRRLATESGGIINIYFGGCSYQCHPRNTAQGKWAFVNGTWAGHRGYRTAALAPEWVQDEKARLLWAGGRGCSHWSAC